MDLSVRLNKAHQIEVEPLHTAPVEKIAVPQQQRREPRNLNPVYWSITCLLLAILGYVYVIRPQFDDGGGEMKNIAVPTPEEQRPPEPEEELTAAEDRDANDVAVVEPAVVDPEIVVTEPIEDPEVSENEQPVETPSAVLVPTGLPPTLAERPAPEPIPIPEKWERLMQLEFSSYEVPGLERTQVLEELEMLAGTTFQWKDDETRGRLEMEPTLVNLKLEETDFAAVLKKTLEPVGLTFELTEDQIVILPMETAEAGDSSLQ